VVRAHGGAVGAADGAAAGAEGARGEGGARAVAGGAHGQCSGCAAVAMAFGSARGVVGVFAVADGLLHGVQVFADGDGNGDADLGGGFEGLAQAREEQALEGSGEGAELDLAELVLVWIVAAVLFDQVIAEADAGAGVVEGSSPRCRYARTQYVLLAGGVYL